MLLYYLDTILPVHPIEVIPEVASGSRLPGATREGVLALADAPWKSKLVGLGEVFMLDYRQPSSVDFWIGTM